MRDRASARWCRAPSDDGYAAFSKAKKQATCVGEGGDGGAYDAAPLGDEETMTRDTLQRFDGLQHFVCVAFDLDLAPLPAQDAGGVDEKRAALNPDHLFAVHVLQLDHIEEFADSLYFIGQKLKRKSLHLFEALERLHAVARDAEQHGVGAFERIVLVAEILSLQRATSGFFLRIDIEDDILAFEVREANGLIAGGGELEIGHGFADGDCAHYFFLHAARRRGADCP